MDDELLDELEIDEVDMVDILIAYEELVEADVERYEL